MVKKENAKVTTAKSPAAKNESNGEEKPRGRTKMDGSGNYEVSEKINAALYNDHDILAGQYVEVVVADSGCGIPRTGRP